MNIREFINFFTTVKIVQSITASFAFEFSYDDTSSVGYVQEIINVWIMLCAFFWLILRQGRNNERKRMNGMTGLGVISTTIMFWKQCSLSSSFLLSRDGLGKFLFCFFLFFCSYNNVFLYSWVNFFVKFIIIIFFLSFFNWKLYLKFASQDEFLNSNYEPFKMNEIDQDSHRKSLIYLCCFFLRSRVWSLLDYFLAILDPS